MIDDGPSQPVPEKFVAAKYSSGKVVNMKLTAPYFFLVNKYHILTLHLCALKTIKGENVCLQIFLGLNFHGFLQD